MKDEKEREMKGTMGKRSRMRWDKKDGKREIRKELS